MKKYQYGSILALALAGVLAGCAQSPSSSAMQSARAGAGSVAATQQARVQRQALAQGLYEVAFSARQNAVFVASAGGFGKEAAAPKIVRLDPATLAVQAEIALERKGFGLVLDDEADRLYVGNTSDASVTVVDTASNRVAGVVQLAEKVKVKNPEGKEEARYPHNFREMVVDKKHHRLYAPGLWFRDSALYVVDTRNLKVERVLQGFGFVATGVTLDEANDRLYVSNLQGQLRAVNTRTLTVENVMEVDADQLLNLVYDRAQKRILATDQGMERLDDMRKKMGGLDYRNRGAGNRVVVLDPVNGKVLHSIPTGKSPVALTLDDARHRLYVTNRDSGTVTAYDSTTYALLHTFETPTHPNSLAVDKENGAVYVTIKNGNDDPKGGDESVARLQF
ncbi:MAG: YncE family protein [Candidimonas sp.]